MAPTRSSLRPETQLRARKGTPRGRVVVALSPKPRDYVPGSGPPLQRVCLLPPQDSTAYIVDRILLPSPGSAASGKPMPKRMTYIVGWRDLPAARLLVPAMQVLDYVSPRALEDWEWEMELQLDEERKKLAEDKDAQQPEKARKRVHPPAHTEIESAAVAEPETAAQARSKMGAMSLTSPQKTRLEDFDGLSDQEDTSPSRQLVSETYSAAAEYFGDQSEAGVDESMDVDYANGNGYSTATPEQLGTGWDSPMDWSAANLGGPTQPLPLPFGLDPRTHSPDALSRVAPNLAAGDHLSILNSGAFTPFNAGGAKPVSLDAGPQHAALPQRVSSAKKTESTKKATPRKKTASGAKPPAEPVLDESGEPVWVVKRLLDMNVYEVEGRGLVRYFRVLWEGDWPPDQNPTWEPEENLPAKLVRNYFKQSKQRRKSQSRLGKRVRPLKPARSKAAGQYSSVSEAFAGGANEDAGVGETEHTEGAEHGSAADELFVVEEQARPANAAWGNGLPWDLGGF